MAAGSKAILAAAGLGTRLRPLTDVLPKCLMPVNGRPLLGIWLRTLVDAGFDEVIVNTHHHTDLVREYVSRSPFARYVTLAHEEELLGTGGTLLRHRERIGNRCALFAHADNLSCFDLQQFFLRHGRRPPAAALSMMTFVTDAPQSSGIVEIDDRGLVSAFHEKSRTPSGNLANAAVYVIEPEVIEFLEHIGRTHIDFSTEVIPHFLGRIFTYPNDRYHRDLGTLKNLARAQFDAALVDGFNSLGSGDDDPWYGLMHEADHRLARAFRHSIEKAFQEWGR